MEQSLHLPGRRFPGSGLLSSLAAPSARSSSSFSSSSGAFGLSSLLDADPSTRSSPPSVGASTMSSSTLVDASAMWMSPSLIAVSLIWLPAWLEASFTESSTSNLDSSAGLSVAFGVCCARLLTASKASSSRLSAALDSSSDGLSSVLKINGLSISSGGWGLSGLGGF